MSAFSITNTILSILTMIAMTASRSSGLPIPSRHDCHDIMSTQAHHSTPLATPEFDDQKISFHLPELWISGVLLLALVFIILLEVSIRLVKAKERELEGMIQLAEDEKAQLQSLQKECTCEKRYEATSDENSNEGEDAFWKPHDWSWKDAGRAY